MDTARRARGSHILEVLAGTLLVFFGGYLRKVLRAAEGEGHMLSAVALVGTTILAIAAAIDATINIALGEAVDSVEDLEPSAVQALSILWTNDFLPFALGVQVLMLAAGISVVRHGAPPVAGLGRDPVRGRCGDAGWLLRLPRSSPLDRRGQHPAGAACAIGLAGASADGAAAGLAAAPSSPLVELRLIEKRNSTIGELHPSNGGLACAERP